MRWSVKVRNTYYTSGSAMSLHRVDRGIRLRVGHTIILLRRR